MSMAPRGRQGNTFSHIIKPGLTPTSIKDMYRYVGVTYMWRRRTVVHGPMSTESATQHATDHGIKGS